MTAISNTIKSFPIPCGDHFVNVDKFHATCIADETAAVFYDIGTAADAYDGMSSNDVARVVMSSWGDAAGVPSVCIEAFLATVPADWIVAIADTFLDTLAALNARMCEHCDSPEEACLCHAMAVGL